MSITGTSSLLRLLLTSYNSLLLGFLPHKTFQDKVISLSLHISAIFTYNSSIPQPLMTSCCLAHSSPLYAWYDSCSSDQSFASIFLQIPPHDRHPWYWLVVGRCDIAPTVNFHHLDICHVRHTKNRTQTFICWWGSIQFLNLIPLMWWCFSIPYHFTLISGWFPSLIRFWCILVVFHYTAVIPVVLLYLPNPCLPAFLECMWSSSIAESRFLLLILRLSSSLHSHQHP